jgi:hypothetical protein
MLLSLPEIRSLAREFRGALEVRSFSTRTQELRSFPRNSCSMASLLFGLLLQEQCGFRASCVRFVRGSLREEERENVRHEWLRVRTRTGGWVLVDLTADQFPGVGPRPVMVQYSSVWHDRWRRFKPSPSWSPEWPWSARSLVQHRIRAVGADYRAILHAMGRQERKAVARLLRVAPESRQELERRDAQNSRLVMRALEAAMRGEDPAQTPDTAE